MTTVYPNTIWREATVADQAGFISFVAEACAVLYYRAYLIGETTYDKIMNVTKPIEMSSDLKGTRIILSYPGENLVVQWYPRWVQIGKPKELPKEEYQTWKTLFCTYKDL